MLSQTYTVMNEIETPKVVLLKYYVIGHGDTG